MPPDAPVTSTTLEQRFGSPRESSDQRLSICVASVRHLDAVLVATRPRAIDLTVRESGAPCSFATSGAVRAFGLDLAVRVPSRPHALRQIVRVHAARARLA